MFFGSKVFIGEVTDADPVVDHGCMPDLVAAPAKFSVTHGIFSGSVVAKSGRVGGGASYELQISLGDPTDENFWKAYDHFAHCRQMEVKGLEQGKVYHFRVRCLGNSGNEPWSTVVGLMMI